MSAIIRSAYDGIIMGGYVERPVNAILNDIVQESDSPSILLYKNTTKITTIWLAFTLTAATAVVLTSVSTPCAATFIVLIPFVKPLLHSIHDFNHELPNTRSTWRKVAIATTWLFLVGINSGFMVGMSRATPWVVYLTAGLIGSNLALAGGLCGTVALSRCKEEEIHINPHAALIADCENLRNQNEALRGNINKLDKFIKDRPELLAITQEYLQKYQNQIAVLPPGVAPIVVEGPTDYIGQRGQLRQEKVRLEHELNERLIFMQMHPEVYECFKRHFEKETSQQRSSTEVSSSSGEKKNTLTLVPQQ